MKGRQRFPTVPGTPRRSPTGPFWWEGGFALITTVSVLTLLAVVAVGLLSLSTIAVRGAADDRALGTARANARLALALALGELQKHGGPDQRVTGPGNLGGEEVLSPHWTGVWSSRPDDGGPVWLVSGKEDPELAMTPEDEPQDDWQLLHSAAQPDDEVRVPVVPVSDGGSLAGHYAWWVSDEGTKARVDVRGPDQSRVSEAVRLARSHSPQENGIGTLDPAFEPLGPLERAVDKRRILTHDTIDLGAAGEGLARKYFHHLTTGGYGLPVNVVTGGMKTDLSIAFDSSQRSAGLAEEVMGALPARRMIGKAAVYDFGSVREPNRFFLFPELSEDGRLPVGPNWGVIYNYHHLWRNLQGGVAPVVEMNPQPRSDLRTNDWPPYRNLNRGTWKNDRQHTNTTITPVISMLQVGFRLSARKSGRSNYQVQLQMKPVVGIWNPYNTKLQSTSYYVDWAVYPYLRIGVETRDGKRYNPRSWMREHWLAGTGSSQGPGRLDRWLRLQMPEVELEPGEIRLFSVGNRAKLSGTNKLVSTWNEEGAFTFDLRHATGEEGMAKGAPVVVPQGSRVWYEDLFLEDSQHPETRTRFGDTYVDGISASWFTFKTGGTTLNRTSDLWQTPRSEVRGALPHMIPEPVQAGRPGTASASPRLPVEMLTDSPLHIGTWRWFSRNAADAPDNQLLRGWVDANPRYASANPLWDGSRAEGRGRSGNYHGWFFLSPFIGGSHDGVYDGGPPGRGKVAEGQNEIPSFPEASLDRGRYRGFGGFSNGSSGQSHVVLFDVPRGPLVSLGQLQHAQLSRYAYEPGFAFGNSYANPRIPLDRITVENFMNIGKFTMLDLSYRLNEVLWDDYFFSTIGRDYLTGANSGDLDELLDFDAVVSGRQALPNPRHTVRPRQGDESFGGILTSVRRDGARALAARIGIEGAFNVNSTSVEAWKAVLSSMADFEFPTVSLRGGATSWDGPTGIRFPSLGHVVAPDGWQAGDGPLSRDFWQGYRRISDEELEALATEIVAEVRERGPFRSFADFVNRDPEGSNDYHQRKGALQAALDRSLNAGLEGEVGRAVSGPQGPHFSAAADGENETAGFAGYLMQSDVLQSLAPVLQARSDYFRIRASGECRDADGRILARAVCEAHVQRTADYLEEGDLPHTGGDALRSAVNKRFGRRFKVTSFRWISPEEL